MLEDVFRLFEEIKDLDQLAKKYYAMKNQLKVLGKQISDCKNKKSKIRLDGIREKIESLEKEREEIIKEIELGEIKSQEYLTIEEFKNYIEIETSGDYLFQKSVEFFKNRLTVYVVRNKFSDFTKNIETPFIRIFKVSKELDEFFYLIKDQEFYKEIQHEFIEIIATELEVFLPEELSFIDDGTHFYVLIPMECNDFVGCGDFIVDESYKKIIFEQILVEHGYYCEALFFVLKNSLERRIILNEMTFESIENNNSVFKYSKFHIKNVVEFTMDITMRALIKKCKRRFDPDNVTELALKGESKFVSENYFIIRKILSLFTLSQSNRKIKALGIIKGNINKYFHRDYSTAISNFIIYAELFNLCDCFPEFINDELINLKEDLKLKILNLSTIIEINFKLPSLINKALIKRLIHDFNSNLDKFIISTEKMSFLVPFYNLLNDKVSDFILSVHYYEEEDKVLIKEIVEFVLDNSKSVNSSQHSFLKLSSIYQFFIFDSNTIINEYLNKNVNLEKYEFRVLMKIIYDLDYHN